MNLRITWTRVRVMWSLWKKGAVWICDLINRISKLCLCYFASCYLCVIIGWIPLYYTVIENGGEEPSDEVVRWGDLGQMGLIGTPHLTDHSHPSLRFVVTTIVPSHSIVPSHPLFTGPQASQLEVCGKSHCPKSPHLTRIEIRFTISEM